MSIKYNEFGEVISVNGLTTGQHIGKPMQDAIAEKPEDNEAHSTALNTVGNSENMVDNEQPRPQGGASSWNDLTDKPFGEIVEILPETTVEIDPEMGMGIIPAEFTLEVGKEYTITYNGVAYVVSNGLAVEGDFAIGNLGAMEETAPMTEEPFCLAYSPLDEDDSGNPIYGWAVAALDGSESVTLSITAMKTLDDKYLSNNIPFVASIQVVYDGGAYTCLPSVTAEEVLQCSDTGRMPVMKLWQGSSDAYNGLSGISSAFRIAKAAAAATNSNNGKKFAVFSFIWSNPKEATEMSYALGATSDGLCLCGYEAEVINAITEAIQ